MSMNPINQFRLTVYVLATAALAMIALLAAISTWPNSARAADIPPQMRSEARIVMMACRADYDRHCGDVSPGGGRILSCLETHVKTLSQACAAMLTRAEQLKQQAIDSGVLPK
jgi:hypothetical protein